MNTLTFSVYSLSSRNWFIVPKNTRVFEDLNIVFYFFSKSYSILNFYVLRLLPCQLLAFHFRYKRRLFLGQRLVRSRNRFTFGHRLSIELRANLLLGQCQDFIDCWRLQFRKKVVLCRNCFVLCCNYGCFAFGVV